MKIVEFIPAVLVFFVAAGVTGVFSILFKEDLTFSSIIGVITGFLLLEWSVREWNRRMK